jgi:hypothetical protein
VTTIAASQHDRPIAATSWAAKLGPFRPIDGLAPHNTQNSQPTSDPEPIDLYRSMD